MLNTFPPSVAGGMTSPLPGPTSCTEQAREGTEGSRLEDLFETLPASHRKTGSVPPRPQTRAKGLNKPEVRVLEKEVCVCVLEGSSSIFSGWAERTDEGFGFLWAT